MSLVGSQYFADVRVLAAAARPAFYSEFAIPHWSDFSTNHENRAPIRRAAISGRVIEALKTDNIHVLIGTSASGKTTLLKEIATRLLEDTNNHVYYMDTAALQSLNTESFRIMTEEFCHLGSPGETTIVLIDNVHFAFNEISDLIRTAQDRSWVGKVVLTLVPDLPKYYAILDGSLIAWAIQEPRLRTTVTSDDIAAEIVTGFCQQFNISQRVAPDIQTLLELCNHNLYHLRFYLLGLLDESQGYRQPTQDSTSRFMERYLLTRLKSVRAKYGDQGLLCIAAVSVWSSFDVSIERHFLTSQNIPNALKIDASIVDSLARDGEIQESWGLVAMPHRGVALAFSNAIDGAPAIAALVLNELRSNDRTRGNIRESLIHRYLQFRPRAINVISKHLCNRGDIAAIISSRPETIDAIFELMLEQADLLKLTETFINFEWHNYRLSTELMNRFVSSSELLLSLLYQQSEIIPIMHFLSPMWFVGSDSVKRGTLVYAEESGDLQNPRLLNIECPYMVPFSQVDLYQANVESRLSKSGIDPSLVTLVTSSDPTILLQNTSVCIKSFLYAQPVLCSKLTLADNRPGAVILRKLDFAFLLSLFDREGNLKRFTYSFSVVCYFDKGIAEKLVRSLASSSLVAKARAESNVEIVTLFLWLLGSVAPEISQQVCCALDPTVQNSILQYGWQ